MFKRLVSIVCYKPAASTDCTDMKKNKTWTNGAQWTEDCFIKTCNNSMIVATPVNCPDLVKPTCSKGTPQLVKDGTGCCNTWTCYGNSVFIKVSKIISN